MMFHAFRLHLRPLNQAWRWDDLYTFYSSVNELNSIKK